jgi:hypothetical protein
MKRVVMILLIALVLLAGVGVAIAAPGAANAQPQAVSFGLLMKPGWVGGEDPPYNYTAILVLRCALLSKYRSRDSGTTTIVITGTALAAQRGVTCASFPLRGMGTGDPIGDGYPPSLFDGLTDVFPLR